jgi:transposase
MIATRQKISPPELAKRWGIDSHKILGWIRSGEMKAIDVSTRQGGRPRYAIDEADILAFENRRAVGGPVKAPRRRRAKQQDVIEFF